MSNENKKYYLGFTFEPGMSDGLHCTHCYFGTLSLENLEFVVTAVTSYFLRAPIVMEQVDFKVPEFFGPHKNIDVRLATNIHAFEPMSELRDFFKDRKMVDTTWPFRPHVTTEHPVTKPFHSYALVCNGVIIAEWKLLPPFLPSDHPEVIESQRRCKEAQCGVKDE